MQAKGHQQHGVHLQSHRQQHVTHPGSACARALLLTNPQHATAEDPTGLFTGTHKSDWSISDECPLFPRSTVKMNALIVLSVARNCRDAGGQKCDSGTPSTQFPAGELLGPRSGRQRPDVAGPR